MKLLASLFFISLISIFVYYLFKLKLSKKSKSIPLLLSSLTALVLIGLLVSAIYRDSKAPDLQCSTTHEVTSTPPTNLVTAMDFFDQGNFDYDSGYCKKAISDYTVSIRLNPKYAQAYNNRAYTYMRLRDYKDALSDLDKALALNPNYVQALMNRGDIHNYYYAIDRQAAIADYEKVISLGATKGTSVCGHLFLARHNGWNLGTFLDLPSQLLGNCN